MREEQIHRFRLEKRIQDEKFNVEHIAQYILMLQVNNSIFRVCVTDPETNRCLLLDNYALDEVLYPEQLVSQLALIYDDHPLLKAGFWKSIRIAVKNLDFSLIPDSLFDKEHARQYLSLNSGRSASDGDSIYYYQQRNTEAVNIFSADRKIIDWFSNQYPGKKIQVVHHTTPLIEGVLFDETTAQKRSMYVHVERKFLTILVKNEKSLEFVNNFYFTTTEDFLYFVLFVFDQLKLNPETTPVTVFGEISPDSPVYRKLYKYIKDLRFGDKPSALRFSYQFDEVFDHRFFDLYSMHFCD